MSITGREAERKILEAVLLSKRAELVALYGRRRVGKTYLIREFYKDKNVVFFNATGSKGGRMNLQIAHFTDEIGRVFYSGAPLRPGRNWDETFDLLTRAVQSQNENQKIILFFDEFPWMATHKSGLLEAFDYYWNHTWSRDSRIKCFICGSSASWIVDKIVNNKGGLHNRMTRPALLIAPMTLAESRVLLESQGVKLNNRQLLQLYMVTGGIPYYLSHVQKGQSATEIINQLAFGRHGLLLSEFDNLFSSLFKNHDVCERIVRKLALHQYGLSQDTLLGYLGKHAMGKLGLEKLKELEDAGFICRFMPYQHKRRGVYYKVIDEYTLFYLKWIEPIKPMLLQQSLPSHYWEKQSSSPSFHSWSGLAFESICYKHISKIAAALKLKGFYFASAWRSVAKASEDEVGCQIDLLFDRDDDAITLCEIKYTDKPYHLIKMDAKNIQQKIDVFKRVTKTKKQVFFALISAEGLISTIHSDDLVDAVITLEDLF